MHIEILEEAREDIFKGTLFYEVQQYGAGEYFLDSISSDIDSLILYAGIHAKRYGFYALPSKRFYYKIDGETIKIYAVLDDRQNPNKTQDRLRNTI